MKPIKELYDNYLLALRKKIIKQNEKEIVGEKSSLFWLFVEILHKVQSLNPNVLFFQENVYSAPKKDVEIISSALEVQPMFLCSSILTAQQRKRWYWSNIKTIKKGLFGRVTTDFPIPKDKGIVFNDILDNGFVDLDKARSLLQSEDSPYSDMQKLYRRYQKVGMNNVVFEYTDREKAYAILESESRPLSDSKKLHRRYKMGFGNVVYQVNPKREWRSSTLPNK